MFIVGKTSLQEIYVGRKDAAFLLNEYYMVGDSGIAIEIKETYHYPLIDEGALPAGCTQKMLTAIGFNENEGVYLAKASILHPLKYPFNSGMTIRKPKFEEIQPLLMHGKVEDSFHLGVILGTKDLQEHLPVELQTIAPFWENKQAAPQKGVPFIMDYREQRVYPHIGLFGTSGSGKSFGLRVLCEEIMRKNIPAIAFDPHFELNFDEPMKGLEQTAPSFNNKYEVFEIGKNIGIPFADLKYDDLVHLFEYVGSLTEPQKAALEVLYEQGDTLLYLRSKIVDLKVAFEENEKPKRDQNSLSMEQIQLFNLYKNKVSGSKTLQALAWKLDSLESTHIFNHHVKDAAKALEKGKMAVIRGDMGRLRMIASYVLKKFYKKRRAYQDREEGQDVPFFPMFFAIIDEAHNFAPRHESNPTKRILKTIAQEARKYGIFEVFCTQKPNGLDETILSQLNTKIIYRLNTADDMEMVKKETNLSESEMYSLPHLSSGHCFISSPIFSKTFAVRFRTTFTAAKHTADPFAELEIASVDASIDMTRLHQVLLERMPFKMGLLARVHSEINQAVGQSVSIPELVDALSELVEGGRITKKETLFGPEYYLVR